MLKSPRFFAVQSLLSSALLLMAGGISPAAADSVGLLVPAYSYPTTDKGVVFWDQLNWAVKTTDVPLIAIMNSANGEGTSADSNYQNAVHTLTGNGGRVIGYVHTRVAPDSLTLRSLSVVKDEIDRNATWYGPSGLTGFFVDEMRSDASSSAGDAAPGLTVAGYYQDLYAHITSHYPGYLVVANPGTSGGEIETYLKSPRAADTLITFENVDGYESTTPPAWTANYPAGNFANIPYNVPGTSLDYFIRLARFRNAGYVYVTDDYKSGAFINPWDDMATYWQREVLLVKSFNDGTLPAEVILNKAPGQAASLFVSGNPGTYQVQTSSDLLNWTNAGATNTTASGAFTWTDSDSAPPAQRFYRAAH